MAESLRVGDCVRIPGGRIGRIRDVTGTQSLSRKVFVGCSVSTEPADFAEFGAHRAPYETAIEASGTDSQYRVRVRRTTSATHQFLMFAAKDLQPVDCPKGWMSPEGYVRYLTATLAKMQERLAAARVACPCQHKSFLAQ